MQVISATLFVFMTEMLSFATLLTKVIPVLTRLFFSKSNK